MENSEANNNTAIEQPTIPESVANSIAKKEHKRSAAYPALTVIDAYDFACKVNNQFSINEVSRDEIAFALKLHPNSVARDVAACVSYGFFNTIKGAGKYKLSDLFFDIFRPENERDKKISFITAFGSPKLYQDLISKFDNNVIPEELPNTLIKHHGITEAAANIAAKTFLDSAIFVGVLSENRLLKYSVTKSTVSKTQYAEIVDESIEKNNLENKDIITDKSLQITPYTTVNSQDTSLLNDKKIPIHLTRNKVAYLIYPDDISKSDIKIIEHSIQGVLLRIELEDD